MRRYFFDIIGSEQPNYDYHGRDFPTSDDACRLAELMALDLAVTADDEWAWCNVKVRNAEGHELVSVQVQSSWRVAA